MEISDKYANNILKKLGYQIKKIPESNKNEADFLVTKENCTDIAIIEAKLKTDDEKVLKKREKELLENNIFTYNAKLGNDTNIFKISSKAKKQLLSSGKDYNHNFKILLFITDGINPDTKYEQIMDSLYGKTRLIDVNTSKLTDCYYYRDSIFYRRKEIDAVILVSNTKLEHPYAQLCLNTYSKEYINLKDSCFIKPFGKAVIDPIELEKQNKIFIPDDNINRKLNDLEKMLPSTYNHLLTHIQKKYSTGILHTIDWNTPTIETRIVE